MTTSGFEIKIIGERINPGFKSTKALFDNSDLAGIQALAVKQAEAGASYLNVNIGARALTDTAFMGEAIQAIQEVVTLPLSFDFPSAKVQEVCLNAYDRGKANGAHPIVNSITEHRWDLMDLYKPMGPFKVILMASERLEDGVAKGNKTADEIYTTARRGALRLRDEYGLDAELEAAPYDAARWLSAEPAELEKFVAANRGGMASDRDESPVFLAKSNWELNYVADKFPKVRFAKTRERSDVQSTT